MASISIGQLHLGWQGEPPWNIASQPRFKLGGRTEAKCGAKVERIVKRRALVLEHNVVRTRNAHDVVDASCAKQGEKRVHVILVGLSVIGVANGAPHRQAGGCAPEVVV